MVQINSFYFSYAWISNSCERKIWIVDRLVFFGRNIIYLLKRTKVWLVTDALKKDSHEK